MLSRFIAAGLCLGIALSLLGAGNPIRTRRRAAGAAPVASLGAQALADGANTWYFFSEASGNAINQAVNSTYDLSVDSIVVRGVASPVAPAKLGMHVPGTNGGGVAPYGHIEGQRFSMNGFTPNSWEAVVKLGTVGAASVLIDGEWTIGVARYSMDFSGASIARGDIINGFFNFTGAASPTGWHHYACTTDGTTQTQYLDGTLAASEGIGGGSNDGTGAAARIAFGGLESVTAGGSAANTNNKDVSFGFWANYIGKTLTAAQVKNHFLASGCPAN